MRSFDCDNISVTDSRTSTSTKSSFWKPGPSTQRDVPLMVAVKEERRVAVTKFGMIITLILVAASFCVTTYLFLKHEESKSFKQQFESHASEVIAISIENVENTFIAINQFAESLTGSAIDANENWPNVTINRFASRAVTASQLAASAYKVELGLVVEDNERVAFEAFAQDHIRELIRETLDYGGNYTNATELYVPTRISYYDDGRNSNERGNSTDDSRGNSTTGSGGNSGGGDRENSNDDDDRDNSNGGGRGNSSDESRGNSTRGGRGNLTVEEDGEGPYVVSWQEYPYSSRRNGTMTNLLRSRVTASSIAIANVTKGPKLTIVRIPREGLESQVIQPIFDRIYAPHEDQASKKMVGVVSFMIDWTSFFANLLPRGVNGVILVLKSSCRFEITFAINGQEATLVDNSDQHDPAYEHMEISADFFGVEQSDSFSDMRCVDQLTLHLYPSKEFEDANKTNEPIIYAIVVGVIFIFTSCAFIAYDCAVRSHQRKVADRVITQDKIVSNLFPATIRDQLYRIGNIDGDEESLGSKRSKSTISGGMFNPIYGSKPIANLFLETTVLFADISGFTAWSSAREPSQVLTLLENIYGAFDRLAHKHGVFKIETIGDCYVAVAGLPEPNDKHATAMAKFARDCLEKMSTLTAKLEIGLGPGTADLGLRVGLHSGQVTAGVLRGERSRFQLFGDTVNVASRMESCGESGKIQVSYTTADILRKQGRSKLVRPRGEIMIPGKGMMQTFWLETKEESDQRHRSLHSGSVDFDQASTHDTEDSERSGLWSDDDDDVDDRRSPELSQKERLIEWNVELLCGFLKQICAARQKGKSDPRGLHKIEMSMEKKSTTVLEEFQEIITLPKVTMSDLKNRADPDYVVLDKEVVLQLRSLVTRIANIYRDNAFHSFEHASHVTASVAKLLSRIVTSDTTNQTHGPDDLEPSDLASHSYGITSDPLTQFAVVFSAIIHDADHPGIPNTQLIKEHAAIADKYKGKSVAEQNSVDLVWEMLLEPQYQALRACIYSDVMEMKRFRQVVVNVVMATDIVDKELGALRKARWNKAFDPNNHTDSAEVALNRKATIVLEHLIQASDVSHTMQHWQVYRKWNEKFFMECYGAWKAGRADTDPSLGWYQGELGFFDFYVLPLAKKLDSCGVFGVSSHEYLSYAAANRSEWEKKGEDIVKGYIALYEEKSMLLGAQK